MKKITKNTEEHFDSWKKLVGVKPFHLRKSNHYLKQD